MTLKTFRSGCNCEMTMMHELFKLDAKQRMLACKPVPVTLHLQARAYDPNTHLVGTSLLAPCNTCSKQMLHCQHTHLTHLASPRCAAFAIPPHITQGNHTSPVAQFSHLYSWAHHTRRPLPASTSPPSTPRTAAYKSPPARRSLSIRRRRRDDGHARIRIREGSGLSTKTGTSGRVRARVNWRWRCR